LFLNLHERWLLRLVGVHRRERRAMLDALEETGRRGGEIDLLAELGGYALGKRSVRKDLPVLFDQVLNPLGPSVHGVAYGDRRYRKPVILAAALHQAGVSVADYRTGSKAGFRRLSEYEAMSRRT
jgi:hypothetical protein